MGITQDEIEHSPEEAEAKLKDLLGVEEITDGAIAEAGGPDWNNYQETIEIPEQFTVEFHIPQISGLKPDGKLPEMPEDPSLYLSFLKNENLFETVSYSAEDSGRTAQYQAEARRVQLQQSFGSIDDYLKGLEMIGEAKPFDRVDPDAMSAWVEDVQSRVHGSKVQSHKK